MKEEVRKVVHKGSVVGEVTVPVYESMEELMEKESEERILSMFNKQNCVRIAGNERAKHTEGRTGKKKRAQIAFNLLTSEELTAVTRDYDALQELLESDEVQARVDEYLSGTPEGATAEAETAEAEVE